MTDLYLQTNKNLEKFFNTLISAQAPTKFTQKFLESLEFTSTNDRLFIKMLKELGFLDASGQPTQRYKDYLDQTQSKIVLAQGIREAYTDLFKVNVKADKMTEKEAKGKIKSLTGGSKSENTYTLMAKTFTALCKLADFSTSPSSIQKNPTDQAGADTETLDQEPPPAPGAAKPIGLHYNIQIILPDTRDQKVYEAIFSSLRRHLG